MNSSQGRITVLPTAHFPKSKQAGRSSPKDSSDPPRRAGICKTARGFTALINTSSGKSYASLRAYLSLSLSHLPRPQVSRSTWQVLEARGVLMITNGRPRTKDWNKFSAVDNAREGSPLIFLAFTDADANLDEEEAVGPTGWYPRRRPS